MKRIMHVPLITACTFVLLLASILLTACAPATPVAGAVGSTPTPEIFIRLDPSHTPAPSDLPLSCQFTDLKIYVNRTDKYCFAYSDRFQLNDQGGDLPLLQGPAVNANGAVKANFKVEVAAYDINKSLDQHVDEFLQGFTVINPADFEHTRVTVDGEPAIRVERARVVVDNLPQPKQMNWRIVFVRHANSLYRLIYRPADVPEAGTDLDELYQMTMGSFAFLEQNLISDPPVGTDVPSPTPLPPTPVAPTAVPPTPTVSLPCDWISFVTDVTVPDETAFAPSTAFVKTWRLKNIGSCTWTPAYSLVFVSGSRMDGPAAVNLPGNVPPGATVDVSVNLTAPVSVNSYTGYWKLRNASGVLLGLGANAKGAFLVKINVICQFTGMQTYTDNANSFCFGYPNRFKLNNQTSDLPLLQGPAVDANVDVFANLRVEVAPFNANKSLDQQVDEFLQGFTVINPAAFEHARVSVGGESAILVERARVSEPAGPVQMNWRIVFIPHGSKLYRLIYRPMDVAEALADLNELYQATTVTFTFFK